ncbi:MAG TPA: type II secretion system protein GspN [Myxococcaceae bacterium]|nr:type II secretion system protein GspN [Myxococcaceae bacterium]
MRFKNLSTRGLTAIGYLAFTLFSLLLFLWLTFPYEVLRQRLVIQAEQAGMALAVRRAGPALFGMKLEAVQLIPDSPEGIPDTTRALLIDRVAVRPSLLPLGVRVHADLMGGDAVGSWGLLGDADLQVSLEGLNPQRGNFLGYTGLDLEGLLQGELDLSMPKLDTGAADFSKANGELALQLAGTQLNGGTLPGALPLDLPSARLGDLTLTLPIEEGVGTLTLSGNGEDLQLQGEGTLNLARRLDASRVDLMVKLRASEAFAKAQPMIGMGLNTLPADPDDPTFRRARVGGTLSRLSFTPGR